MKKRRHRKALEMYRKAMSDVAKKANPFSSIEEEDRIISSFFAGSSLETIFNALCSLHTRLAPWLATGTMLP